MWINVLDSQYGYSDIDGNSDIDDLYTENIQKFNNFLFSEN